MRARDYQVAACEAIEAAMAAGHRSILAAIFTGAGKTLIFSLLAHRNRALRFLVIAPQRELVWQAAEIWDRVTGETPGVEMGRLWADLDDMWSRAVIACRASLTRGRYRRFLGVDVIVVDEAHTCMSEQMLAMLREFQDAGGVVVGVTATPFRMDGKPMRDFYEAVAFEYGLQEALADWWCCPPRARIVKCAGLNLSNVRVTGGDWSAADLDLVLGASKPLHELCLTTQRERVGSAIVYLPGVNSARAFAGLAKSQYGLRADFVCGNTYIQSEEDRALVIDAFRRGEIDVLANCQIATMGFDAPIAQTAILGRPTRSRVLWQQIVGRLTRPEPGCVDGPWQHISGDMGVAARRTRILQSGKPYFKVVDITDETADHSIVTAVDMFAKAGTDAEAIRRARKRAEDEEGDPGDMLAQEAEALRKAQLIEAGLRAQQGQADGRLVAEDVSVQGRKKSIAEYRVPLRGKYSGRTMGELPDDYIQWALRQHNIRGWVRTYFSRERDRRRAVN